MQNRRNGDDVDQLVELYPALAKRPHHAFCRGYGQRNQQYESGESGRDEWTLKNVVPHGGQIQRVVDP